MTGSRPPDARMTLKWPVRRRDLLQSISLWGILAPTTSRSRDGGEAALQRLQHTQVGRPASQDAPGSADGRSVRATATECLSLTADIEVRHDLFGRLEEISNEPTLRDQLTEIASRHCGFAIPPNYVPRHPRLGPISSMHVDHYNSSVSDLPAPEPGDVNARLVSHSRLGLGTCLNFLQDDEGALYGFCGSSEIDIDLDLDFDVIEVVFTVSLFDDSLEKVAEHELVRFARERVTGCDPPLNLGYFVVDHRGRILAVARLNEVQFIARTDGNDIGVVQTFELEDGLQAHLTPAVAQQTIAQVLPSYDRGYWVMALGDRDDGIPAYLGRISDSGVVQDVHVFDGETIANGMAIDESGVYVMTDRELYKAVRGSDDRVVIDWHEPYERASSPKPGTECFSHPGSGSTPTLLGTDDDLVAITDNADGHIKVRFFDRATGRPLCSHPVFERGESANENTLVGYGDSVVTQNWFGARELNEEMLGVRPGLTRIDVEPDRRSCEVVWDSDDRDREFASTATVRLSTRTGLLYAPIQVAEGDAYEMAFLDFQTGRYVQTVPFPGTGSEFRISHLPPSVVPGGRLVQPVRSGHVVFEN